MGKWKQITFFAALFFAPMLLLGMALQQEGGKDEKKEAAKGDPARGKQVFEANCQICHSADSEDATVGPGLKNLFKKPPHKLADGTEHKQHTVPLIRDQIVKGSSAMPPVGSALSAAELDDLIAYLQTL